MATATSSQAASDAGTYREQGSGWLLFAGIMIVTVGILNGIYGIAAISDSTFFVADQKFILSGLNTWGWVMLILGVLQIVAAFSIWSAGGFGRWFGIACAVANMIAALLAIPAYPFWSLVVIAIDLLIIYGLAVYGGDKALARR
jgi:hypothetical protein